MGMEGPTGGPLVFKVRGDDTGGVLTVLENQIAVGDGPPCHVHANEDESWWVTEGTLRFLLGDGIAEAPAGSFVFVPRGTPYCFQNIGDAPARILVMFTPSGIERFFDAFAEIPVSEMGPEAFARVGAAVGIQVVGPPLSVSHPLN